MAQNSRAEIEALLASPQVDIIRLRQIARQGLPHPDLRPRVWPLLLGISLADLKQDHKLLVEFTEVHNEGKHMTERYNQAKAAYVEVKRLYDGRRDDALAKYRAELQASGQATEENQELGMEETRMVSRTPPNFVYEEAPPDNPPMPTYPTQYWDQITKDIERSLWKQIEHDIPLREKKRDELHRLICAVICTVRDDENKPLHYFQGYHDIASVLLLACGEEIAFSILKRLSTSYLRDQMQEKIDYVTALLQVLWPLVQSIDPQLGRFLNKSQVQPYAALPWVMTWFSHVLEDQQLSERMFDFFLASPSWIPLYLAAALVLYMAGEGLYSCPCEFSEVHNFVSKFCARTDLPWERLIRDSLTLYTVYPPQSINANAFLPADSYLLRYPYYWVPKHEVIYQTPLFSKKNIRFLVGASIVVVAMTAAAGVAVLHSGPPPH